MWVVKILKLGTHPNESSLPAFLVAWCLDELMIELGWAPGIHLFLSLALYPKCTHTHTHTHSASAGDGRPVYSGHLLLCWLFPHGLPETLCGSHSLTKYGDRPVNRRHLGKQHWCIKGRTYLTTRETTDDSVYAHFKKSFTSLTLEIRALNTQKRYQLNHN